MKRIVTSFILLFFLNIGYSQIGGRLYIGLGSLINNSELITPADKFHSTTSLGLDAVVSPSNPGFIVGLHYARLGINPEEVELFKKEGHLDLLEGRFGFNINLINFNDWIKLRTKLLGVGILVVNGDFDAVDDLGHGKINEALGGGVVGLGLTLGSLLIDVEYYHLLNDAFDSIEDSSFTGLQLKLGVEF